MTLHTNINVLRALDWWFSRDTLSFPYHGVRIRPVAPFRFFFHCLYQAAFRTTTADDAMPGPETHEHVYTLSGSTVHPAFSSLLGRVPFISTWAWGIIGGVGTSFGREMGFHWTIFLISLLPLFFDWGVLRYCQHIPSSHPQSCTMPRLLRFSLTLLLHFFHSPTESKDTIQSVLFARAPLVYGSHGSMACEACALVSPIIIYKRGFGQPSWHKSA
ncbi:hypothetical protein LZ31DRAFT_318534 [Colletotrichum somersetense]|nr:hypothetical protein LZ31DRAFT_318534 [Colletotrichum somersetense]